MTESKTPVSASGIGDKPSGDSSAVPEKTFKITFLPLGKTIEVGQPDPEAHHEGQPGSILDWADQHDIELVTEGE